MRARDTTTYFEASTRRDKIIGIIVARRVLIYVPSVVPTFPFPADSTLGKRIDLPLEM